MFPSQYALANWIDHPRTVYPEIAALGEEISGYARQLAAEARLRATRGASTAFRRVTREEIASVASTTKDVMRVLQDADAASKAELYGQLRLHLTYRPAPRTVTVRADLERSCTQLSCPRGDLNPHALIGH
jgi:hypothetical protein